MGELNLPISIPSHSSEPMFGGSAGRSYDGGTEVFIARTLETPFLGDDTKDDFSGDTGSVSAGDDGISADSAATIYKTTEGPSAGDQICYDVLSNADAEAHLLLFGLTDANNCYIARIHYGTDEIAVGYYSSGTATWIDTASVTVAAGTAYTGRISWYTDDYLGLELLDSGGSVLAEAKGSDPAGYTASGYGHEFTGASVSADALRECGTVGTGREPGMIDDFDDGKIPEYSGDTVAFTTQTTTVYEGSHALKGVSTSGGLHNAIRSTSGLDRYPEAGDTFQARIRRETSNAIEEIQFGVQDGSNHYTLQTAAGASNDKFRLHLVDGGSVSTLASAAVDFTAAKWIDNWFRVEIEWGDSGAITATLYESSGSQAEQISATDPTYSGGGIGWQANASGSSQVTSYFDAAEITAINS